MHTDASHPGAPAADEVVYEEVLLTDMDFVEDDDMYYYQCPCGDVFELSVEDLKKGKRIARCPSCSLKIKVLVDERPNDEDDDGVEWQSLPHSLFDDVSLVAPDCESFSLAVDEEGASVSVVPERHTFERRDAPDGALGTGADVSRMTGALLWDSSVVLASWLVRNRASLRRVIGCAGHEAFACVELGAGLGLVGLAAAATLGAPTTLTDRSEVMPLLERGIARNGLQAVARAAALEWGDAAASRALGTFGLVLASDCIYEESAQPALCATLAALLDRTNAGAYALVAWDEAIGRPAAAAAFRAHAARHGFSWENVEAAAQEEDDDAATGSHHQHLKSSVRMARLRLV